MIQPERIQPLNESQARRGRYILYWMQASQRAECNHALEFAIEQANDAGEPVVVLFGITDRYPGANSRHYAFMLEGLGETRDALAKRGIQLLVQHQPPEQAAVELAQDASMLIVDRGYLRHQKAWRYHVAVHAGCPVVQVETDVIVPVETTSRKEEWAAATIRGKIHRQLPTFLRPLRKRRVQRDSLGLKFDGLDLTDIHAVVGQLDIDRSVPPVSTFRGGTSQAKKRLRKFLAGPINDYADRSNDPTLGICSDLSPYLHFGQISPLYVALRVRAAKTVRADGEAAFLEQLIVRRELSMNFVNFNPTYDSMECLHDWAKRTLRQHESDAREYGYSLEDWEQARTHDPYWNAAQREMVLTGKMHNYMRMYWGKKILEWTRSLDEAYRIAIHLNDKYELDGRDPNGYTGVAWCFGKHDRAWGERPVFGKVRYMNDKGLKRKFDMPTYLRRIEELGPSV